MFNNDTNACSKVTVYSDDKPLSSAEIRERNRQAALAKKKRKAKKEAEKLAAYAKLEEEAKKTEMSLEEALSFGNCTYYKVYMAFGKMISDKFDMYKSLAGEQANRCGGGEAEKNALRGAGYLKSMKATMPAQYLRREDNVSIQKMKDDVINNPEMLPIMHVHCGDDDKDYTDILNWGQEADEHFGDLNHPRDFHFDWVPKFIEERRASMRNCLNDLALAQQLEEKACTKAGRRPNKFVGYKFTIDVPNRKMLYNYNKESYRVVDPDLGDNSALRLITELVMHMYTQTPFNQPVKGFTYCAFYYEKKALSQLVILVIPRRYNAASKMTVTICQAKQDTYRSSRTGQFCAADDENAVIVRHKGDPIVTVSDTHFGPASRALKFTDKQFVYINTITKLGLAAVIEKLVGGFSTYKLGRINANAASSHEMYATMMLYNDEIKRCEKQYNTFYDQLIDRVGYEKATSAIEKAILRVRETQDGWSKRLTADWTYTLDDYKEMMDEETDGVVLMCFDGKTKEDRKFIRQHCIENMAAQLMGPMFKAAAELGIRY